MGSSLQLPKVHNQRRTKALSKKPSEVPWLGPACAVVPWPPDSALLPGSRPHRWSYCTPDGIQRRPPPGRCSGRPCTHRSSDSPQAGTRGAAVRPPSTRPADLPTHLSPTSCLPDGGGEPSPPPAALSHPRPSGCPVALSLPCLPTSGVATVRAQLSCQRRSRGRG